MDLVTRYQDRVYRLALRMSRNEADAEEIVQETLLLAHRSIATFHGDSRFATWLYRIAINQALMRRRAARRRPVQSIEISPWPAGAEPYASASDEPPEGTDDLVHQKLLAQQVRLALVQLEEGQRAALVLCDLEELSSDEAAEILAITPAAVRQRAHRARLRLRDLLGGVARVQSPRRPG
ncbi:MAG TPA: sigma-70 family RNA polymerase sigma factor [Polyangiaceae bacterium]